MTRFLVTGSAQGVGYNTAVDLLGRGHQVVVHVRGQHRLAAVTELVGLGAQVVVGDFGGLEGMRQVCEQVASIGHVDVVIHNAGVYGGTDELAVNVVAPYVLAAALPRPRRQIFVSSDMHPSGRPTVTGIDWSGRICRATYSDSKLLVTTLGFALGREWPEVASHVVDPGWVATRMGGPSAPDDLRQAHATQVWLATCPDEEVRGGPAYWYHLGKTLPAPAVEDLEFQDALLHSLAEYTGLAIT